MLFLVKCLLINIFIVIDKIISVNIVKVVKVYEILVDWIIGCLVGCCLIISLLIGWLLNLSIVWISMFCLSCWLILFVLICFWLFVNISEILLFILYWYK